MVASARQAVLELLAEVGYDGFELTDVATRAGVNKTTVYRRWPTKAHLVFDAAMSISEHDLPGRDTGTLLGDLTSVLADQVDLLRQPAVLAALRIATTNPAEPELQQVRARFWDERFRRTGIIVDRAVARGEVPDGVDARLLLEHASSPVYFRALVTHEPITDADLEMFARRAIAEANRAPGRA